MGPAMGIVARLLVVVIVVVVSWVGPGAGPAGRQVSHRTGRRARVVVYLQDVTEELDEAQLRRVAELCKGHGYTPVAVVQERPGGADGLIDALRMVRSGEADRIVMASRDLLPDLFESATGERANLWLRELPAQQQRPARHRRTRPTRRGGEGA